MCSSDLNAPAASGAWISSDVSVATVGATGLVNGVNAGTATITFKDINGCIATADIQINGLPSQPIAAVVQPDCVLSTGTITVTNPVGAGFEYSIDGANYQASTAFAGVAAGTYSLTVKNSDGCISPVRTVIVNPQPTTPVTPVISSSVTGPVCAGTVVTLTSSISDGNQWYKDGAAITGANGQTYQASLSGDYTVIVTSGSGCISNPSAASTVSILPKPTATISQGVVLTSDCGSSPFTLTAVTDAVAPTYQWFLNDNPIKIGRAHV